MPDIFDTLTSNTAKLDIFDELEPSKEGDIFDQITPSKSESLLKSTAKGFAKGGATFMPKAFWGGVKVLKDVANQYPAFTPWAAGTQLIPEGYPERQIAEVEKTAEYLTPEERKGWTQYIPKAAETLGQMAGSAVATAGVGTLPAMAAGAGIDRTLRTQKEGESLPKSLLAGGMSGTAEYLTELTPLKYLSKIGLPYLKRLAGGLISDVPGEIYETFIEMKSIDEGLLGKKYTPQEYAKAILDTAATSAMTTGIATTAVQPFRGMPPKRPFIPEAEEVVLPEGEKPLVPSAQEPIKQAKGFTPLSQPEIPLTRPPRDLLAEQQPLPKPENVEIVKPQPKGFTPIEAAPAVSIDEQVAILEKLKDTMQKSFTPSAYTKYRQESIDEHNRNIQDIDEEIKKTKKQADVLGAQAEHPIEKFATPPKVGAEHVAGIAPPTIHDELLQVAQTENIFRQVKGITSAIKIDKGFFDHFDRTEVRPIVQKSPGLFSTKKGMPLDEVADGLGISTDVLADKLRNAVSKKEETELLKKQIQEYSPPTPQVTVGELGLKVGDKFKIHGEQYTVKERDAEGSLVIKNGDTYTVDEFDTIPQPDEGSLQIGKTKYAQPKMFEGEKANIKPQMEADIQGQQKMFEPKAGQLTSEQFKEQISDVNIGMEGKPSIKSEAPIRYAPGTSINLETLDLPVDVKSHIYKLTQQYQPQFEDARNRKTWEEINKEAESSGFDTQQLLERQKGEAYNAAKLKATKDIQNNTALETKRIVDESVRLLKDVTLTEDQQSEILVIANMKMKKAAAILAQANGAYSEAGRALNILRQVTSATKAEKNWKAILDVLGGREMTLDIFKKIAGMDTADTPQVARFIREIQKAKTPDMVMEAWRNAILSGTKTLITNPLSNAITFLANPIETGIAATLEKGRSLITGKKPQVYYREIPAELAGAIDGIWNGTRVFLNTMKTEIPTFGETKIETANQLAIPGKIGQVFRVPQTILMAQDDFAKAIIYDSTMKAMATRYGIRKGLKGRELVDFVGNLLSNPQGRNKKIYDLFDKRARAETDYRTYNKALGKIGQMVMRLREIEIPPGSGIKPIYYILPFIRTPTNIFKFGLERTPLNFARLGYKTYKNEIQSSQISKEFAKPVLGTIIALWGWLMFEYGYMTGDAPKDDTDRKTWYNAGKKPYSFYIPWLNRYISYQRIEPLGSILGSVADFFENTHRGVKNTKDAFTKILLSIVRNWSNKTFILGATNAINAYTDPERYGDRFVDGLGSSVIPNIISSFNPDPYYRQKETFSDAIKAKIPILSETLLPQRDILGEPAKRGESRGSALMNQILPFGVTKPSDDPIRQELLRLNDSISFSVGMPNKYFMRNKQKIEIPLNVYDDYSKESGELAYKLVKRIVGSKNYSSMGDDRKASIVRKQFDIARDYIRPKYINQVRLKQNPQIGR